MSVSTVVLFPTQGLKSESMLEDGDISELSPPEMFGLPELMEHKAAKVRTQDNASQGASSER